MRRRLESLKKQVAVGIVGGSDYNKIKEQLGGDDSKNACLFHECY